MSRGLDYDAFMKADPNALVAAFARHLGVELATPFVADGGSRRAADDQDYAVAHGGLIRVRLDARRRPLSLHYRAPAGCPSVGTPGDPGLAPADANARVLTLLRRMGIAAGDAAVESQLHQEGRSWLGVHVRQRYRGETIELPSVFAIVDGITGRLCELRLPRWYAGLDARGPALSEDALRLRAEMAAARLARGRPAGTPSLGALRIMGDVLCREVSFGSSPEGEVCLDVVTGTPAGGR